eukprot:504523-Hanusia_phi.AAC.1
MAWDSSESWELSHGLSSKNPLRGYITRHNVPSLTFEPQSRFAHCPPASPALRRRMVRRSERWL